MRLVDNRARGRLRAAGALSRGGSGSARARSASADEPPAMPPARRAAVADGPRRGPSIELAVGMGASIDDAGLRAAGLSAIPSFFAMGGFGRARSASTWACSPTAPPAAIARPTFRSIAWARRHAGGSPAAPSFVPGDRSLPDCACCGALAMDLGLGYERDSRIARGPEVVDRFGARLGVHVDLPLTPRRRASELRLRLAVRRFVGASTPDLPRR